MTNVYNYDIIAHANQGKVIRDRGYNMKGNYIFEYFDEIKFKKCERSLKKYNMFAFKKLIFEFYPKMKEGEFLGDIVSTDEEKNTVSYELTLPADELFTKVHGEIVLHYDIYTNKNIILLKSSTFI